MLKMCNLMFERVKCKMLVSLSSKIGVYAYHTKNTLPKIGVYAYHTKNTLPKIHNASYQIACRREKKLRQPFVKKKIRTCEP